MSLVGLFKGNGPNGFGYDTTAEQVTEGLDLSGQTILITGCNSGLGLEAMRVLTLRGATVLGLARTKEKAAEAGATVPGTVVPYACELSEPESVRAAVRAILDDGHRIDAMILNAGIMALPKRTLKHGHELQFLTNHLGHFILATGLLGQLTEKGRVVVLSSAAHTTTPRGGIRFDDLSLEQGYQAWTSYGQSKLANLLFARALSKRLPAGQVANAVHPGVINTNLGRHMPGFAMAIFGTAGRLFLKTTPQGAATEVWAAVHPDMATVSGEYLADCNIARSSAHGRDDALAERLWTVTEELVAAL
ncbi:MAG: SDR family NAD(P)-dependent oxidoreductase [Alphaproteobacteria bacterium]|nr:SDR family NAD(P)-dependent oxidoreductase [Alphaproteobacteria bacterium]